MKQRSTRQLVATLEALASSCDHPTAEQVCERVRAEVPQISLGTIYRNLDKLCQQGKARIVRLDGITRYDAMMEQHDHFICAHCARVIDVQPQKKTADPLPLSRAGYVVSSQSTAFYGICPACARPRRSARAGRATREG